MFSFSGALIQEIGNLLKSTIFTHVYVKRSVLSARTTTHAHMHTLAHTCTPTRTRTHTHTHTHACTRTRTHTHQYARTRTVQAFALSFAKINEKH